METKNKKLNVLLMTELTLMTVIVILMAFTPLGYLRLGTVEITFIVVPVAVGAVLLGGKAGAFLGFVFGLTSLAQCFGMSPLGTVLFGLNPLGTIFCCIVPRIFVGLVPAFLCHFLKKITHKDGLSTAIACLSAPLTNTVLYLFCICVLFQDTMMQAYNYTGDGGVYFLGFIFASVALNAVLEAVASLILGTAICQALKKSFHM